MTAQRDDILKARDELELIINDMDRKIKARFKDNFERVMKNFEEIFRELFGGGQAELRLENEDDPLNSGIDIIAQPPGKKLQNINLMSGGEKTMTAIALMFAVLKAKPTPKVTPCKPWCCTTCPEEAACGFRSSSTAKQSWKAPP